MWHRRGLWLAGRKPVSSESSAEAVKVAGLARRAIAHAVDTLCMLVVYALTLAAVLLVLALGIVILASDTILREDRGEGSVFLLLLVALWVPSAWMAVYCYEVLSTAKRGQTFGKRLMGICVVRHVDPDGIVVEPPDHASSNLRWAIPHVAVSVAAVLFVGVVHAADHADLTEQEFLLWWLGLWALAAVAWSVCYVSALFGKDRRGWHDKAAGTIVVQATDEVLERLAAHVPSPGEPSRWGRGAGERPVRASQDWSRRLPPPS